MPVHLDFDQEAAYKTLKAICKIGPRVSGTETEIRTVLLIEDYFRQAGLSSIQILAHKHTFYDAKRATFGLSDDGIVLDGVPCWMSASTPAKGLEAETLYVGPHRAVQHLKQDTIAGKIVVALLDEQVGTDVLKAWKKLYALNPSGVVFLDIKRDTAPRAYANKALSPLFSKIPSIVVPAMKARPIHTDMFGTRMKLVVSGSAKSGNIQSIQCRLEGKSPKTVLICAHHDTHSFTPGATDDAAGVAIMLELARGLAKVKTNLSYQFMSFGGEEMDMKGSWAYTSKANLSDIQLCINLDSIGELPGVLLALSAGSDEMIEWVAAVASENKYPAVCRRAATSGGDNIVFAANGIPTIHLASYGTTTDKVSHSSIDEPSLLTPFTIGELGKFACAIIEKLESSDGIPFKLDMPRDLLQAAKQRVIDAVSK